MTGGNMLRFVDADMAASDALYRKLISNVELTDFNSSFDMEQIKFNTALRSCRGCCWG